LATIGCVGKFGVVTQGLMQYLSDYSAELVWRTYCSRLRTIQARYSTLGEERGYRSSKLPTAFFVDNAQESSLTKFITDNSGLRQG